MTDFLDILTDFPVRLAAMAVLLGVSAFFSAAETALFNLSRDQLRRFRASANPLRRLASHLMDDPRRLLVTVLWGNTTANTAFYVTGVMLIEGIRDLHPQHMGVWQFVIGVTMPLAVMVVAEVIPKSVAATMPELLAPPAAVPLVLLGKIVSPIRVVLGTLFVTPLARLFTGFGREEHAYVTADELQAIVEVAAREGVVTVQESDMLGEILELGDLRVREVMMPRVEVVACDRVTPMPIVLAVFRRTRVSKMLVYEGEMDNIVGVVYAKAAFLNPGRALADLVRPVYFVPESKTVESLLKDFRSRKIQFAVAVDEYGGVSGLVTLEDCLEEIVGEISDETDRPAAEPVQRVSAAEYLLAGNLSIRSWADAFDIDVPDDGGRYSTVAGFITALLGRLPRPGDVAEWRNLGFTVEDVRRHRVTWVRLRLLSKPGQPAAVGAASGGKEGGA